MFLGLFLFSFIKESEIDIYMMVNRKVFVVSTSSFDYLLLFLNVLDILGVRVKKEKTYDLNNMRKRIY